MAKAILMLFVLFPPFLWGWADKTILGQGVVLAYAVAVAAWHVLTDRRYSNGDTMKALLRATILSMLGVVPAYLAGRGMAWFVPY